jgi:glucose-1-phosphatase
MTAPTFIFDLGGVLVRHDNPTLFDRLAACCAESAAAREHLASGVYFRDIDTGRLSIKALHQRLATDFGFNRPYGEFLELWSSHFSEEPGMDALLAALVRRHRVALFSNTNPAHIEHVAARYPATSRVHARYYSFELGLVKPDAAAFERVLELEGRRAEDCIFVDDRADNTAAAAALGMRVVTFTGRDALFATLTKWEIAL